MTVAINIVTHYLGSFYPYTSYSIQALKFICLVDSP